MPPLAFATAMTQPEPTASAVTGPLRTCIATGEQGAPERMIRFVVGPEGDVVPDLARRLPGRGLWVQAERAAVEQCRGEEPVRQGGARGRSGRRPICRSGSSGFCWNGRSAISAGRAGPAGRWRAS